MNIFLNLRKNRRRCFIYLITHFNVQNEWLFAAIAYGATEKRKQSKTARLTGKADSVRRKDCQQCQMYGAMIHTCKMHIQRLSDKEQQ